MTSGLLVDTDALRANGGMVHIRSARPADRDALLALNGAASDRSIYLRFFAANRLAADSHIDVLLQPASRRHHALVAEIDGTVVGVAALDRDSDDSAEIGLLICDAHQHEGIGTLLLEHLAATARRLRIKQFVAEVLTGNGAMVQALHSLGFAFTATLEAGVTCYLIDLYPSEAMVSAMDRRDRTAELASLRPLLAPASVVVIGAGRREQSVGHQVLRNIVRGGYAGSLYVVNPGHSEVLGVPCFPSAGELPVAPDLAVIAVPAEKVLQTATDCGRRGTGALMVLSSGFGESGAHGSAEQDRLVAITRQYGMRLVGPNCLGLINTDATVRLNATFAPLSLTPGGLALVSQSGALGIAVLRASERVGLGISQFVSVGNKADVSGNDLLMCWEADERTQVIGLYLESFGNPRRFARIARRVSRTKPILAIKAGRSEAGQRAGQSHTAAAASSDVVVDALFDQAGVVRVDTMEQLLDAVRALSDQPLPAGPRIGIIGNSGGPGILAADAAAAAGLVVVELSDEVRATLTRAAPTAASTQNPIDLGAGIQPAQTRAAIEALLNCGEVDSVLAVFTETLVGDPVELTEAVGYAAGRSVRPLVLAQVGEQDRSLRLAGMERPLPVFGFPERAAQALAAAWRYARIRQLPQSEARCPSEVDVDGACQLISTRLAAGPAWLGAGDAAALLGMYGIKLCPQRVVTSVEGAVSAATELGFPVAMKLADGTVHKTEVGGVRTDLADAAAVRATYSEMVADRAVDILVQPMVVGGTELIVGGLQDRQFGPVVMVGAGGIFADLLADRRFRLAPVGVAAAEAMIGELRFAKLLDGYRGLPPVSRPALAQLLVRLGWLVENHPEVAEIDLNPVIGRGEELTAVDAKIRLAAAASRVDVTVRQLSPTAAQRLAAVGGRS
jgi:acyl-CoA synthetase (NDP forming)/N-acetylglutamate synthase-like GNAT family acetyltransferase